MTLFWRVVAINAGVLVVATLVLALSPATVSSSLTAVEIAVLTGGVLVVIAVNILLLRRVFVPLERLSDLMRRVDLRGHSRRVHLERPVAEVAQLAHAFNEMLERLERERRTSGRRALAAQERERRRLARELHDELGQTLTGVVLQLEGLGRAAPPELRDLVTQVQEATREGVEEVREIARGLRPAALDEFGLRSALVTLAAGFAERSGLHVRHRLAADLPELAPEQDLTIYRVAQESLTNVGRHADAADVLLALDAHDGAVVLRVRDNGRGFDEHAHSESGGVTGMRERALLIGGRLTMERRDPSGTEVVLEVPVGARS